MEEGLFHNPTFVNYINEFAVAAAGHREGHTLEERVNPLTGKREQVCPVYDSIACDAHQATYQQAGGKFEFNAVPTSFVCQPDGTMIKKVSGMAPNDYIEALKEAQMKIGKPPLTGSAILKMERDLYKGDGKLRSGKFNDALKLYKGVAEDEELPEFVRARADARVAALEEAALAAIEEAKALEPRKAKRELKKLLRNLDDLEEAKAACEAALEESEG